MINPSNNKLLSIINSFSKVELNRLSKFIESPYFNSNSEISDLYKLIISRFEKGLEFTKEDLWSSFKMNEEFNSLKLRKVSSDLLKLVEQYLSQEIYEKNDLLKANFLLNSVSNRELKKLYSTSLSNAYRVSGKSRYKESQFYLYQYQREKSIYELRKSDLDRSSSSNLKEIIDNLDYFYLAEKMRYLCEILIRENVISMEYEILFRDEIIKHLEKYGYRDVPLVSIYYQMYLTLNEDEDSYYKLKSLLVKYIEIFPQYEAREIYTSVINYCIKKINIGDDNFLNEFIQLNETLLEKNIIADNELSPWRFKNIVTVGLKLSKFEWVENFIEKYKNKIPLEYRDNAITFNTAQLYFYQKKYKDLLPLLLQVEYEDFTYSYNSKLYTVITYYELQEEEALESFVDSYKVYIRRQKSISDKRKSKILNFLNYTKKLLRYKSKKNHVGLTKMESEIKRNKETVATEWLLEKIDQLLYPNGHQKSINTEYSNQSPRRG